MRKLSTFTILIILLTISVSTVAAQGTINLLNPASPYNNLYALRPSQYVRTIILWLLGGSGIAAFIYLLMGGFQWITSGGDKDAAEKARKKISFAMIGLAVVFSAYALVFVIRALFGVNLIEFTINNIGG